MRYQGQSVTAWSLRISSRRSQLLHFSQGRAGFSSVIAHFESSFASCFTLLWGGQVILACASRRTAVYCSHAGGEDAPLQGILRVAQPSSRSSICMCSLLIAADRALELVPRQRRRAFPLASAPVYSTVVGSKGLLCGLDLSRALARLLHKQANL